MIIPIPDWSPDSPAMTQGVNGAAAAFLKNVVPTQGGYRAVRDWTEITTTSVDDRTTITGAFSAKNGFRTVDYTGDGAKLYAYDSDTASVNNVSNGTYTTQTGDFWDFTQFGNQVIACNGGQSSSDVLQLLDTTAAVSTAATNLGGTPPRAGTITTLRDFVVLGNTYDATDGARESRVWWSGFGDATLWTPSAATQSDLQDLVSDVGAVQRVLGGQDAFVVCQNGVVLMRYVGPPIVMQFDNIYPEVGTAYPLSCVRIGPHLYMYSKSGFVRLNTQGGPPEWIGAGVTNDSFFQDLLSAAGGTLSDRLQVRGAHDPYNQVIWWTYGASGAAYGYSYAFNKWCFLSHGAVTHYYTSDIGYSANNSRLPTIYGFSASDRLYGQVGSNPAEYAISTGYIQYSPGRRSLIRRTRPLVDHETAPGTMRLTTFSYNDPATNSSLVNVNQLLVNLDSNDGHFNLLTEGRFINLYMLVTGAQGEQHIHGFDVESASATGKF